MDTVQSEPTEASVIGESAMQSGGSGESEVHSQLKVELSTVTQDATLGLSTELLLERMTTITHETCHDSLGDLELFLLRHSLCQQSRDDISEVCIGVRPSVCVCVCRSACCAHVRMC
jgi:hypothetical protein